MIALVAAAWSLTPLAAPRLPAGTNNVSRLVETATGPYILRVYQSSADARQIAAEHALLAALGAAGLSFAVPAPVPTNGGAMFVPADDLPGAPLAALFPVIPGDRPTPGNAAQTAACGAALAELDMALATIGEQLPAAPRATFGDLDVIHPLIPDPLAAVEQLPLPLASRQRVRRVLATLLSEAAALYRDPPRQLTHGDYGRSNVLIVGDRVTGVLDFEMAGRDLRATDLAVALTLFLLDRWGDGAAGAEARLLASAYLRRLPLSPEEVRALPTLMLLQRAASLIHRLGRVVAGTSAMAEAVERVESLLAFDRWRRQKGDRLVADLRKEG